MPGDRGGRSPVKNKPILTSSGAWLVPASRESEHWDCFADISTDGGRTWRASELVPIDHATFLGQGVIQPTLWESEPGTIHMLMRSTCGFICRSDSADNGLTWSTAYPTALPNNNSGMDLARLPNGDLLLAHNPVSANWGARTPLVLSISRDNGLSWNRLLTLEDEGVPPDFAGISAADTGIRIDSRAEFSYPAVIPLGSGVAVAYTWKRKRMAFVKLTALEIERWNVSSLKGAYLMMTTIGLLTFSDGRSFVAEQVEAMNRSFQDRLRRRLEEDGYRVVAGEEIISTNEQAVREAKRLAAAGCDCTIFNFAVWVFPHLPALASRFAPGPFLLFSNVNPEYPGLVGMLASAGALARFECSADEFLATYASNHIHAVYGDWVDELRMVADLLGIEARVYGSGEKEGAHS